MFFHRFVDQCAFIAILRKLTRETHNRFCILTNVSCAQGRSTNRNQCNFSFRSFKLFRWEIFTFSSSIYYISYSTVRRWLCAFLHFRACDYIVANGISQKQSFKNWLASDWIKSLIRPCSRTYNVHTHIHIRIFIRLLKKRKRPLDSTLAASRPLASSNSEWEEGKGTQRERL